MKWKVRELSVIERALLLDTVSQFMKDELNVSATIELLSRVVEIENESLIVERVAGKIVKKLSDEQLERLLCEITPEQINEILKEALEKNKLFFVQKTTGGTTTEGS